MEEWGQRRVIVGAHGMSLKGRLDFYHIGKIVSIRQN